MDNNIENIPRFAVVGHPNKGKSSIVSALAQDDSVQISDTPGTTKKRRIYPLKLDNKTIYELIDTPGFQRARRVLAYMKKDAVGAHKKSNRINEFIKEYKNDPKYSDEIELLEPIMSGAGIIYVVDGSKPYGAEYEAEMEILRLTGEPSMALINMIGKEDYLEDWKKALHQYFKMVRVFNPLKSTFSDSIELLEAVSYLNEDWTKKVKDSIEILKIHHVEKIKSTAYLLAENIANSLSHVEKIKLKNSEATNTKKELLEQRYKDRLVNFELKTQKKVELLWNHKILQIEQNNLNILDTNLFSKQSQSIFGLSKKNLILTALASGGITGAGIDMVVGGTSFMLGSLIGATIGGASAFLGYTKLADIKILGQDLGKKELAIGPMKNLNFPYILLSRSLLHAKVIINRSHALRSKEELKDENSMSEKFITSDFRKELEKLHGEFRKERDIKHQDIEKYAAIVFDVLLHSHFI